MRPLTIQPMLPLTYLLSMLTSSLLLTLNAFQYTAYPDNKKSQDVEYIHRPIKDKKEVILAFQGVPKKYKKVTGILRASRMKKSKEVIGILRARMKKTLFRLLLWLVPCIFCNCHSRSTSPSLIQSMKEVIH